MKKKLLRGCVSTAMILCMAFLPCISVGAVPKGSPSDYINNTNAEEKEEFVLNVSTNEIDMSKDESVDLSVSIKNLDKTKGPIKDLTYYANGVQIGKGIKVTYKPSESDLHFENGVANINLFAVCKHGDGTGGRTNIETLKVKKDGEVEEIEETKEKFILNMSTNEIDMSKDESVDLSISVENMDMKKGPIKEVKYYANGVEIGQGNKFTYKPDEKDLHYTDGVASLSIFAVCKHGDGTGDRTSIETLKVNKGEEVVETKEKFILNMSTKEIDMSKDESVDLSITVENMDMSKGPIKDVTYYANGIEIGKGMKCTYKPDEKDLHYTDGVASLSIFAVCKHGDGTGDRTSIETLKVNKGEEVVETKEEFEIKLSKEKLNLTKGERSVDVEAIIKSYNKEKGEIKDITYYANGVEIGTGKKITFTPTRSMIHFVDGVATFSIFAVCKYADGTGNRTDIKTLKITTGSTGEDEPVVKKEDFKINVSKDTIDMGSDENYVNISVVINSYDQEKGSVSDITYYASGDKIGTGRSIKFTPSVDSLHFVNGEATLDIFAVCKYKDGTGDRTDIKTIKVKQAKEKPPVVDSNLKLSVSGDTNTRTSSINKKFEVTNNGNDSIDVSKVVIRYYFTKDSQVSQNMFCDNVAMHLNVSPYYQDIMRYVETKIVNVSGDLCYAQISFKNGAGQLPKGNRLEIQTRLANSDWSMQDQSNDYSNKGAENVVMLYNNQVVWGSAPSN